MFCRIPPGVSANTPDHSSSRRTDRSQLVLRASLLSRRRSPTLLAGKRSKIQKCLGVSPDRDGTVPAIHGEGVLHPVRRDIEPLDLGARSLRSNTCSSSLGIGLYTRNDRGVTYVGVAR
jgi:hypothetical protein